MEYKNIISLESDSIGRITLNDPPYNALSIEMMAEISEALSIFRTSDIKVLILEARGTFFSTGLDLREHLDASIEDVIRVYHTVFSNLERIHAPTLALVGGAALGAGFELLLSCDMVIASDAAEFGLPQVRAGTIPTIAPTLLPRIMPGKKAVELMLTGDSVGANKAMELGIVNHVLPRESFREDVEIFIREMLLKNSSAIMGLVKKAYLKGLEHPPEEARREIERIYTGELMRTDDMEEGLSAHQEKRPPIWKNR